MSSAPVDAAPAEGPSHVRVLSRPWRVLFLAWTTLAILLSFNQQFTLRFFIDRTLLDSEYYWLLVALLLPLAFVLYPPKPGLHADRVPWYDVLLFGTTTAIAGALIWSARASAAGGWEYSGSDLAPRWLLAGAVAMWVLVLEALRRAGGLALTVIMGVFSVYPLFAGWVVPAVRGLGAGAADQQLRLAAGRHVVPRLFTRERARHPAARLRGTGDRLSGVRHRAAVHRRRHVLHQSRVLDLRPLPWWRGQGRHLLFRAARHDERQR
jgi:hypothetical protein